MGGDLAIGIDFGTTCSRAAVWQGGRLVPILNKQGEAATPSCAAFVAASQRLVGAAAQAQAARNPGGTVLGAAKRLLAVRGSDQAAQEEAASWLLQVTAGPGGRAAVHVDCGGEQRTLCPEQLAAGVLSSLRRSAEAQLGAAITKAVISVPDGCGTWARQALQDAALIAGLELLRLVPDTAAAAIAHTAALASGVGNAGAGERHVLIFDLGGGTLSVALVTLDEGIVEVKSIAGDSHLGGADFDARLASHLAQQFASRHGQALRGGRAHHRLRAAAERAKRQLSSASSATVELEWLMGSTNFYATVTRTQLEDLCADLFQRIKACVEKVLWASEVVVYPSTPVRRDDIHEVVLVGSSARMPRVQQLLRDCLGGQAPFRFADPDQAVVCGAAVQAAILSGQAEGDPAVQDMLLLEACPLHLGLEEADGKMGVVIPANTLIPTLKQVLRMPGPQDHAGLVVQVWEGMQERARDNSLVGQYLLDCDCGLPPGQEYQITLDLDANSVLGVQIDAPGLPAQRLKAVQDGRHFSRDHMEQLVREEERLLALSAAGPGGAPEAEDAADAVGRRQPAQEAAAGPSPMDGVDDVAQRLGGTSLGQEASTAASAAQQWQQRTPAQQAHQQQRQDSAGRAHPKQRVAPLEAKGAKMRGMPR